MLSKKYRNKVFHENFHHDKTPEKKNTDNAIVLQTRRVVFVSGQYKIFALARETFTSVTELKKCDRIEKLCEKGKRGFFSHSENANQIFHLCANSTTRTAINK